MTDVVTPGFHRKIRDGAIINNPCIYTKSTVSTNGTGLGTYKSGSYDYTISGPLTWFRAGQVWPSVLPLTVEASKEASRFYALSSIDNTPYQFGEDIGEIAETIRFLKNPLGSLRNVANSIRDLKYKTYYKRRKTSKYLQLDGEDKRLAYALAEAWAEYRFAAAPLVRSIHDGYEALKLPRGEDPKVDRKSARGFSEGSDENMETYDTYDSGTTYRWEKSSSLSRRYHSTILYEVTNPVYDWRYRMGLREKDLAETFWQLVPYSFMVDRVVNVSRSIRGLMNLADPQIRFLAASTTLKETSINSFRLTEESRASWDINANGETRIREDFLYSRELYSPSSKDAIPDFTPKNLVNDLTKVLDLTSLILLALR